MRDAFVVLLFAVFTIAAFYLVVMNRASEKVITTVVPIAVVALVGTFLSVFVFGGIPRITARFPVSFTYDVNAKTVWLGRFSRHRYSFLPEILANARMRNPEPFRQDEGLREFEALHHSKDYLLYHHLLQWEILNWMRFHYSHSWQIEPVYFDMPGGTEAMVLTSARDSRDSTVLSNEDIEKLAWGNVFAQVDIATGRQQIVLPPHTKVTMTVSQRKPGEITMGLGEINLKNNFCTVAIQTADSSWSMGPGEYGLLEPMPYEEAHKFATISYVVKVTVEFNRLRGGHPEMEKYRLWTRQLIEGLTREFDEQVIWDRTKQDFVIRRLAEERGRTK